MGATVLSMSIGSGATDWVEALPGLGSMASIGEIGVGKITASIGSNSSSGGCVDVVVACWGSECVEAEGIRCTAGVELDYDAW